MFRSYLLSAVLFVSSFVLVSQTPFEKEPFKMDYEAKQMIQILPFFSTYVPQSDFGLRYGSFSSLGIGLGFKMVQNVTFNASYSSLFGGKVKDISMIDSLRGSSGELIDASGNYANINFLMRGGNFNFKLGKIIRTEKNANNGIWLQAGFSYVQHRIKFEYQEDVLPQLDADMFKGYDRLSGGAGFVGSIGYHHITANNTISYFANLDFAYHSAQSLRGYNYDTNQRDQAKRKDVFSAFSIGIILPVKARTAGQESLYK